jgi:hypothetical protein
MKEKIKTGVSERISKLLYNGIFYLLLIAGFVFFFIGLEEGLLVGAAVSSLFVASAYLWKWGAKAFVLYIFFEKKYTISNKEKKIIFYSLGTWAVCVFILLVSKGII